MIVRHGRQKISKPIPTLLGLVGIIAAVAVVSTTAVLGIAVSSVTASVKESIDLDPLPGSQSARPLPIPDIGAIPGGVNLLVVGSDSGQGDPAYGERGEHLGDVTMLVHIANDHSNATVVSFPRDLYVDIPECDESDSEDAPGTSGGTDKLNTALAYGGLACTVRTITNLTGLEIPYAAVIEFNGVIEMSNAVGGVPVCVAELIQDEDTGLELAPGEYTLQGLPALQFLRTRHGIQTGSDTARISSQQVFLASLARTVKGNGTLGDPIKLYGLARAAAQNMTLSTSLNNITVMVSIARALQDIPLDRVSFVQYPTYTDGNGLSASGDAQVLIDALAADQAVLPVAVGQGSQDATPPAAADPATAPPAGSPGTPVELPPSITGQTADKQTCTAGRSFEDQ